MCVPVCVTDCVRWLSLSLSACVRVWGVCLCVCVAVVVVVVVELLTKRRCASSLMLLWSWNFFLFPEIKWFVGCPVHPHMSAEVVFVVESRSSSPSFVVVVGVVGGVVAWPVVCA